MCWKICRFSAARPEPRSTQEPPGLAPFWRLFRFSASVDHQMTPALFRPLFRAYALSRPSLADWLSGIASRALRPKASHRAGLRLGDVERCPLAGKYPPIPLGKGRLTKKPFERRPPSLSGSFKRGPSCRLFRYAHSGYGLLFRCLTGVLPRYCPALHGFGFAKRSVLSKNFSRKQNNVQAVAS